jgi:hypothetical protein
MNCRWVVGVRENSFASGIRCGEYIRGNDDQISEQPTANLGVSAVPCKVHPLGSKFKATFGPSRGHKVSQGFLNPSGDRNSYGELGF